VLWQNTNASLPRCHAYRKGEIDRSLITSDKKTDRSTRHQLSDQVAASTAKASLHIEFCILCCWLSSYPCTPKAALIIRYLLRRSLRLRSQLFREKQSLRPLGGLEDKYWPAITTARDPKNTTLPSHFQILGSRRLLPGAAYLPPLQQNAMRRAGGALLGVSQWKREKEGRSVGGARRMNAAAQTGSQLTDDR
jgi:hypothetical protein